MKETCIIVNCPVQHKRAGCGYLSNGIDCNHPIYREEWMRAMAEDYDEYEVVCPECDSIDIVPLMAQADDEGYIEYCCEDCGMHFIDLEE